VDALLTRLGNIVEEQLSNPVLDTADFDSLEDLVAACRQVASLQPDGTRQPMLRCEGIAALLQGMLEQGEQQQQQHLLGGGGGGGASSSGSGISALSPEAEAYAQRVARLVRRKLGELRTAVPSRMTDAGSGEGSLAALAEQLWPGRSTPCECLLVWCLDSCLPTPLLPLLTTALRPPPATACCARCLHAACQRGQHEHRRL
jgi:hypothetical protein